MDLPSYAPSQTLGRCPPRDISGLPDSSWWCHLYGLAAVLRAGVFFGRLLWGRLKWNVEDSYAHAKLARVTYQAIEQVEQLRSLRCSF